jgi:hypothetical protein
MEVKGELELLGRFFNFNFFFKIIFKNNTSKILFADLTLLAAQPAWRGRITLPRPMQRRGGPATLAGWAYEAASRRATCIKVDKI